MTVPFWFWKMFHERVKSAVVSFRLERARDHGALLRPLGDVIVVMPPLAIDLPLLDRLGEIVYDSIREVCTPP